MLNELCQLADALEIAGITPKDWHPKLKLLPKVSAKKPCYRIAIDRDGSIKLIDTLSADLVAVLRKWEPSNGNSFPGFNIQPLYRITDEDQKKQIKAWREGKQAVDINLLKSWCTAENDNCDAKIEKKLSKCLRDIPESLSDLINSKDQISLESITMLLERVVCFPLFNEKETQEKNLYKQSFLEAIEKYLWSVIEKGESAKILLPLLIHEGSSKEDINPNKDRGALSVYLDIPDWKEYPVASRETIERVNTQLVNDSTVSVTSDIIDAFGSSCSGSDEKLPSVKLPIIGSVHLRAMSSESLCQRRYGKIDAVSFPVGRDSRKRTKGALEWLGDVSREGETWGRTDSKELLFAYPVLLPNVSLKLAACMGAGKSDNSEARFADAAKHVIRKLEEVNNDLNAIELRVFSLKKMDTARTKVVFHRNYTGQRLADAAQEWEAGCTNIPDIRIRAWGESKGKWTFVEQQTPFPLQVAECLNRVWKQDGTTECQTPVIPRSQGIDLLLDEQPKRFVPYLLAVLLQNGSGLFLSLGDALHRGEIISVKGYNSQKKLMPSILGLLLYKLDIRKESYMNNAPFLVGRMLKLADELHALYCKEVRDNKLPSQLIGNTLMTAALSSPVQALDQLALRIKPYYGWAQTYRGSESGGLAGYFIGLLGDVATQLKNLELPARFSDEDRAQLLLGYLAANPKKGTNQNESL
ncbi:MAG: hypothetical protein GQ565_01370 [Candidatus Aegiribacteria sp.]|nr:hypothetical protein [Candidatus Aegiribacteria sp.]